LVGDGDDLDLLVDLEAAFGIGVTDNEREHIRTVGDIYAIIGGRFSNAKQSTNGCLTAMAFYRVRRALRALGSTDTIAPDTTLRDISPLKPKQLMKKLESVAGLRMPSAAGLWTSIGIWLSFAGGLVLFLVLLANPQLWLMPTALILLGSSLVYWERGILSSDCETVGGLAKKAACLNLGRLVIEGARPRDSDLWNALTEVLANHSSVPPSFITPNTRFF
jgi:hypothetical protein